MNLYAYDKVNEPISKSGTWLNTKRQVLYSREIKYEPYTILLKKYNPKTNSTDYYVGMVKTRPTNFSSSKTIVDDYGRIKIRLDNIFRELAGNISATNEKIKLVLVEESDDGEIYLIENL